MNLTRQQILDSSPTPPVAVSCDEWVSGGVVFVHQLTLRMREKLYKLLEAREDDSWKAKVVIATACDENGEPLFTDADLELLLEKSYAPFDRVVSVAYKMNEITSEAVEAAKKN